MDKDKVEAVETADTNGNVGKADGNHSTGTPTPTDANGDVGKADGNRPAEPAGTAPRNAADDDAASVAPRRADGVSQLRAVSHPTRLRIISLLGGAGPMTTSEVAEAIHETVGTVSYHLRQLERNGLVDKGPSPDGDGRKSYWAAPQDGISLNLDRDTPRETGEALLRATHESRDHAYERFLRALPDLPKEWAGARDSDFVARLTAEEWQAMLAELSAFADRWDEIGRRHTDGDGSRMVMTVIGSFPYMP